MPAPVLAARDTSARLTQQVRALLSIAAGISSAYGKLCKGSALLLNARPSCLGDELRCGRRSGACL